MIIAWIQAPLSDCRPTQTPTYFSAMPKKWTEPELWVAMNVYCRLPFGQFDQSNGHIKTVAERMGRYELPSSSKNNWFKDR